MVSDQIEDLTDDKLSSLFSQIDVSQLSKPFDKYLSTIESFYTNYTPDSLVLRHYNEFNVKVVNEKEVKFINQALCAANYDIQSLNGENIILFTEPVIVSTISLKKILGDEEINAIRLISFIGTDKKYKTKSSIFGPNQNNHKTIRRYNIQEVVLGLILPKYSEFVSLKSTNLQSLHTNKDKIEVVSKALQHSREIPEIEMENIKNKFSEINSEIKRSLDKLTTIQDDIRFSTNAHKHAEETLTSIKSLHTSIRTDIQVLEKDHKKLKLKLNTETEHLNKIQELIKENNEVFDKEEDKIQQIESDTKQANKALLTIQKQLVDANREKNLSNYDMVGHSDETVKQTRLYFLLAILVFSGLLWMSLYVYQNGEDFIKILPHLVKVSAWDILLSRLPLITATILIIGGLSSAFFLLIKHIVSLNTEKMTMLKAAILAEQITNSLDCKDMTEQDKLEFTRETKIKLIMQVFTKKDPEIDLKNLTMDLLKAVGKS